MPTILTGWSKTGKSYHCRCSIDGCTTEGPTSLFVSRAYDGGERICRECDRKIKAERKARREALPYYLAFDEPFWGEKAIKHRQHQKRVEARRREGRSDPPLDRQDD